jgi:NAD(P)-dependent dehydrogenase (short-subunit alcohol dehydrogenase family)
VTLAGKVAIVTGAASGAGRATALRLARDGAAVVVADVAGAAAETVAAEIERAGGRAVAVESDVRDEAAVASMTAAATTTFGRLDILHNNAADLSREMVAGDRDIVDLDINIFDRAIAVNLRGAVLGCKHAIPAMLEGNGGVIVNTASTSAFTGDVVRPAYGASKAGLVALTRYVATMYGRRGIRCNAVAPGLMLTPPALRELSDEQLLIHACERLVDEAGRPEDLAGVVAFLVSDEARYIQGEVIVLDGGVLAHRPSYSLDLWREHHP